MCKSSPNNFLGSRHGTTRSSRGLLVPDSPALLCSPLAQDLALLEVPAGSQELPVCRNSVTMRSHLKMNSKYSGCKQRARAGRGQNGAPARTPQTCAALLQGVLLRANPCATWVAQSGRSPRKAPLVTYGFQFNRSLPGYQMTPRLGSQSAA